MPDTKLKIENRDYVLMTARRYEQLTRLERDAKDSAIARKGRAEYLGGKMKTTSHEQLKRELGL